MQSELAKFSLWATGAQFHCGALGNSVEHFHEYTTCGAKELCYVPNNPLSSSLSTVPREWELSTSGLPSV